MSRTPAAGRRLATRAAHAGNAGPVLGPAGERPHTTPLFLTSSYVYPDFESAQRAAEGEAFLYSRVGNPTTEVFEAALADLEGGEAAAAFGSGMAAIAAAVFTLGAGRDLLADERVYGGSIELLRKVAGQMGIAARFVDACDLAAVRAALTPATGVLLVETLSNPLLRVADLPALGALAAERGAALVVDSTFATPCLCRPLAHGATLVAHSVSKYIGGHGDVIGGALVGGRDVIARVKEHRRLTGGVLDPFSAWLATRGLRTLPVRIERQCATAVRLAGMLATLPAVRRVHHPSRADHPDHEGAQRLLALPGAIVSFELADDAAARRCFDRLEVIARAASLGEVSSLMSSPAAFSHRALSPEERARTGIAAGLLRLSVGLEDAADLEDDLRRAITT